MENNEDNRQMTVIAAEIERQKLILEGIQKNHDSISGDIAANKVRHTIGVLESLLPKEQKMIESAHGTKSTSRFLDSPLVITGEWYYLQTFKPYEK